MLGKRLRVRPYVYLPPSQGREVNGQKEKLPREKKLQRAWRHLSPSDPCMPHCVPNSDLNLQQIKVVASNDCPRICTRREGRVPSEAGPTSQNVARPGITPIAVRDLYNVVTWAALNQSHMILGGACDVTSTAMVHHSLSHYILTTAHRGVMRLLLFTGCKVEQSRV